MLRDTESAKEEEEEQEEEIVYKYAEISWFFSHQSIDSTILVDQIS